MGIFTGSQVVFDLTTQVRFKEKVRLKRLVIDNGGIVSYIVTKNSTHVVVNDPEKIEMSYKCRTAGKYGVPVVSIDYVQACVKEDKLLNTDDFLLMGKGKSDDFKSGKITATRGQKKDKKKTSKPVHNVSMVKVWSPEDKNCPDFRSDYQVAKFAMFRGQRKDKSRTQTVFTVLEVHVQSEDAVNRNSQDSYKYRVFSHSGTLHDVENGGSGKTELRFSHAVDEAVAIYSHLYREQQQPLHSMSVVHEVFSRHIGSTKFRKMMSELGMEAGTVAPPVGKLVDYIWQEAAGELESILTKPVNTITAEQVEKAEAVLKQLKLILDDTDKTKQTKLIEEFYSCLPHKDRETTLTKAWLSRKQDTCQLIKDMVSVSEATDWSTRSSVEAKYRALRCQIEHVPRTSPEFKVVKRTVNESLIGQVKVTLENVYAVHRPLERDSFNESLENKQLLFHSSRVENFVGILSRGLLLPKVVVDDFGGTRSDPGMLGSGIYFASAASTSVSYSTASKMKGTRLMLINEVALGKCIDVVKRDMTLTSAPEGYNSVHGVRRTDEKMSEFTNDEYVVYSTEQQQIKYLIEFSVPGDNVLELDTNIGGIEQEVVLEDFEDVDLNDVQDIIDPMSKVKAGLVTEGDAPVELTAVHVRAKLMDMASEVVVLQIYKNNSPSMVEGKYVFPLGEQAAVCGFEAFINDKHIVGEVKEKETAHKEYKKAVSEGHGAYLMDQDEETPDVFTVSVGNLPAYATVVIKITYVEELQVEGEMISFRLPGSVAPWKVDSALKDVTQDKTDTFEVSQGETTVEVSVKMPFDIRSLECTTNQVKVKKTTTMAVVSLQKDQSIVDGFQLLIGLAEIHVPRMWVESKTGDQDHRACMLSFYPEFEAVEEEEAEIIFLLDLSNSMKGDNLRDAKKVLLLTLEHLSDQSIFNIVVFGTAFKELFPASMSKNASTVRQAKDFIKRLQASMGNTEVIRPLHTLYLLNQESALRNIFLISDGHVNNVEPLLTSVSKHVQHTRIFTCGVSSTANRHLLRTLARVGAGAFEFFDNKVKSKWEGKVKGQLSRASQPGLTSVAVHWQQYDDDLPPPVQAPCQITALFNGSRQVVYGFVPNCTMATLKAVIGGYEVSTVVSTPELSITEGQILHRLTARAIIRDWEDGVLSPDRTDHEIVKMNAKNYVIELSKDYSIVTQFTSFVAIEKRDEKEGTFGEMSAIISGLLTQESVDIFPDMMYEEDKEGRIMIQSANRQVDQSLSSSEESFDEESFDEERCCMDDEDVPLKFLNTEEGDALRTSFRKAKRQAGFESAEEYCGESEEKEEEEEEGMYLSDDDIYDDAEPTAPPPPLSPPPLPTVSTMSPPMEEFCLFDDYDVHISASHTPQMRQRSPEADEYLSDDDIYDDAEPTAPPPPLSPPPLPTVSTMSPPMEFVPCKSTSHIFSKAESESEKAKLAIDKNIRPLFQQEEKLDELVEKSAKLETSSNRLYKASKPRGMGSREMYGDMESSSARFSDTRLSPELYQMKAAPMLAKQDFAEIPVLAEVSLNGGRKKKSEDVQLQAESQKKSIEDKLPLPVRTALKKKRAMEEPLQTEVKSTCFVGLPASTVTTSVATDISKPVQRVSPQEQQLALKQSRLIEYLEQPQSYPDAAHSSMSHGQPPPPPPPPQQQEQVPLTQLLLQKLESRRKRVSKTSSDAENDSSGKCHSAPDQDLLFNSLERYGSTHASAARFSLCSNASFGSALVEAESKPIQISKGFNVPAPIIPGSQAPPLPPPSPPVTSKGEVGMPSETVTETKDSKQRRLMKSLVKKELQHDEVKSSAIKSAVSWRVCGVPCRTSTRIHDITKKSRNKYIASGSLVEDDHHILLGADIDAEMEMTVESNKEMYDVLLGRTFGNQNDQDVQIPQPKHLHDYGIGSEISSILKGTFGLNLKNLSSVVLSKQDPDGHWSLTDTLDKDLGVDRHTCWKILDSAGLRSYGLAIVEDIQKLISTLVVLFSIIKLLLPQLLPLNFRDIKTKLSSMKNLMNTVEKLENAGTLTSGSAGTQLRQSILSAVEFCSKISEKYPLMYSTLELGHSWDEVVARMLGIHDLAKQCGEN